MVPVSWLVRVLAFAFMALSMFGIGLQMTAGDLRGMAGSGGRLGRMLAANFILVPAVGVVVARTLIPDPAVSTAFLLLACTPGGVSALNYSPYIKGAAAFAGGSAVLLSFLSIFVSPLLLRLALPGDVAVVVPYGRLVALLLLLFLLPLAVGMAVRRLREGFAARLALPCIVAAVVAATVAGWLIATEQKQAVQAVGPRVLLAMLGFVILSMLIGWLMSGGEKALRPVYVIVTGMRNVAVCLLIALHTFPDLRVQTALVAFSALMVFPNMAVYYYHLARRVGPKLRTSATEKARHLRQGRRGPG
jgi:BASS family bile acid:Na+ symporter